MCRSRDKKGISFRKKRYFMKTRLLSVGETMPKRVKSLVCTFLYITFPSRYKPATNITL